MNEPILTAEGLRNLQEEYRRFAERQVEAIMAIPRATEAPTEESRQVQSIAVSVRVGTANEEERKVLMISSDTTDDEVESFMASCELIINTKRRENA